MTCHLAVHQMYMHQTSAQVGVKATLGVPRYSGVADVVRGVKALSTREKETAPSDVSIRMLNAAEVKGMTYGRVSQTLPCLLS